MRLEVYVDGRWVTDNSRESTGNDSYILPLTRVATPGTHQVRAAIGDVVSEPTTIERYKPITIGHVSQKLIGLGTNVWGNIGDTQSAKVWTEAYFDGKWQVSRVSTAQSNGNLLIPLTYGINSSGVHRYRVGVQYADGSVVRTQSFELRRLARPTIATAGTKEIGKGTNAWGKIDGGAGVKVWTEVLVDGKWKVSRIGQADSYGNYVLPLTYAQDVAGTQKYRVGAQYADGTVARSTEATLTRTNPAYDLDKRCLTGRALCASKTTRKLHWVVDGKVLAVMDARFGKPSSPTREGQFSVGWKSRYHVSSLYGSSMPWAMFFSGGQAVHYSADFAAYGYSRPGSHGCINIRDAKTLDWVYSQVRVGDKVVVHW